MTDDAIIQGSQEAARRLHEKVSSAKALKQNMQTLPARYLTEEQLLQGKLAALQAYGVKTAVARPAVLPAMLTVGDSGGFAYGPASPLDLSLVGHASAARQARARENGVAYLPGRDGRYVEQRLDSRMGRHTPINRSRLELRGIQMDPDYARAIRGHELTHFLRSRKGLMDGIHGESGVLPGVMPAARLAREELAANLAGAGRAKNLGTKLRVLAETPLAVAGSLQAAYQPHGGLLKHLFRR